MRIKNIVVIISVLVLGFSIYSCKSPTGPSNKGDVSLSMEDVTCTEAWLQVNAGSLELPVNLTIKSGDKILFESDIAAIDTTIYIDSLSPNETYQLQGFYAVNGEGQETNKMTVTTKDTTSSNYTWKMFSFGGNSESSRLNDVAIINDTLAYAVGAIHLNNSSDRPYNLAVWNGNDWKLKKIQFYTFCGQQSLNSYPGEAVISLNDSTTWIASNNSEMAILNDSDEMNIKCLPVSVSKMWVMNNNEVYTVGVLGQIGHYKNGSWQKVESGTNLDLYDIYSSDGKTIYAAGGNYSNLTGVLLKSENNNWKIICEGKHIGVGQEFNPYFPGAASTVWVSNNGNVYFGGEFLFRYAHGNLDYVKTLQGNYLGGNSYAQYWGLIAKIRGNSSNDIVFVGQRNTIMHFNGFRWQQLGTAYNPNSSYEWLSVAMKGNLIIAVGVKGTEATVMVLRRN